MSPQHPLLLQQTNTLNEMGQPKTDVRGVMHLDWRSDRISRNVLSFKVLDLSCVRLFDVASPPPQMLQREMLNKRPRVSVPRDALTPDSTLHTETHSKITVTTLALLVCSHLIDCHAITYCINTIGIIVVVSSGSTLSLCGLFLRICMYVWIYVYVWCALMYLSI